MDPNETLTRLRQAIKAVQDSAYPHDDDALELAEMADALDNWLSRGGFLPEDWKH